MNQNILDINETIKVLNLFLKDLKKHKFIVLLNESQKLFISINYYLNELQKEIKFKTTIASYIKINNNLITDLNENENIIMKSSKINIKNSETFLNLLESYKRLKIMN